MKDMRSRRMIVVQDRHMNDELVKGYMQEGFGVIEIPDFSTASKSSADYLMTVIADEMQEFLKDGEQVVVLQTKRDKWTHQLLARLSRRKLRVTVQELS